MSDGPSYTAKVRIVIPVAIDFDFIVDDDITVADLERRAQSYAETNARKVLFAMEENETKMGSFYLQPGELISVEIKKEDD